MPRGRSRPQGSGAPRAACGARGAAAAGADAGAASRDRRPGGSLDPARGRPSCAAPSDRRGRCGRAGLGAAASSLTPLAGSPWRPRSCFAACAEHGPRSARRPRSCCGESGPAFCPAPSREARPAAPHAPETLTVSPAGPRGAGTGSRRPTTSCTRGRTSPCCSARPRTPPTSTATAPAASWSTGTACSGPARCSRTRCCSGT